MRSTKHAAVGVSLVLGVASMVATAAHALDMTGTYVGKFTCRRYAGTDYGATLKFEDITMQFSQSGSTLRVHVTNFSDFLMDGNVYEDPKKPDSKGHIGLTNCGNSGHITPGFDEVWEFKVTANPTAGTQKFSGQRVAVSSAFNNVCKGTFKRIDSADPVAPACP